MCNASSFDVAKQEYNYPRWQPEHREGSKVVQADEGGQLWR